MTAIAIQKFNLLAFLISFIKSLFRRVVEAVQAIQVEDAIDHSVFTTNHVPVVNRRKHRSGKWKEFTPSRYVRWICINEGPNRMQRRKDAKSLRLYQKHSIRREMRLVEQAERKQLRQLRKENTLAAG